VDNFARGLTSRRRLAQSRYLLHSGNRCHRGQLSRSDPAPRIRHARKASGRGSTILRTPSDHFVATCALRRPTTRKGAEPRLIRCCGQIHNATLADYGVPAEGDYRRPGTHPEDSLTVVRSARTHLTYGEWLRRGFDRRSSMLFLENFTALDKNCPDCHQVPSISGVCGCDSAFRSQIRSQHSTQQVQQPASQGRDAGAWYPDKRGARVVARSLRSPTHRPDPDAFLPAANGVQPAPHVLPEPQRARRRVS
jgi:hypothetical protein